MKTTINPRSSDPYQTAIEALQHMRSSGLVPCATITVDDEGEYRCPGPDGREASAYYTDDKQDALGTIEHIWKGPVAVKFRRVRSHI